MYVCTYVNVYISKTMWSCMCVHVASINKEPSIISCLVYLTHVLLQSDTPLLLLQLQPPSPPKLISAGDGSEPLPDNLPAPPESQVALLEDPDLGERLQRSRSWNREPTRWSRHRPTNASFRVRRGRPVEGTPHRVPSSTAESGTTSPPPAPSPPPTPPQQQAEAVLEPAHGIQRRRRRRWSRSTARRIVDLFSSHGLEVQYTLVLRLSQELVSAMLEGEVSHGTFERISARASELEQGHLARDHEDYSSKSIHWFSGVFHVCLWCVCVHTYIQTVCV